ncbi:hypothetical protein RHGRI_031682 [Rhododendron griersonianum]|uniref:Uncharacterized protein n=1 Tax=Rhododendron griersonianum TaxID=479676 RepID=A0AAV6I9I6_9ERIC|nr:hypothetical protein RHGRI_031682 [Rhododendron griersonianum]
MAIETRPPFTLDLPLTAQRKEKRRRDQLELIRRPPTKAPLLLLPENPHNTTVIATDHSHPQI